MQHSQHRRQGLNQGIFSLWRNWALSVGFLAGLIILSPLVNSKWVPLAALALEFVLICVDRSNRKSKSPICFRLPHIVSLVLLFTAISVLIALFLLQRENTYELKGQPSNPDSPAITILLLAPITCIIAGYYALRGNRQAYCRGCENRNGNSIDRGFLGAIYARESAYQTRILFTISAVITVVTWIYYWFFYINININKADTFFFTSVPVVIYIISLIYLGGRYYTMWTYYSRNESMQKVINQSGTTVRYLVIHDDSLFVTAPTPDDSETVFSDDLKIDIPLKISVSYRENLPLHEAAAMFRDATGIPDAKIRFLYETHDYSMYNNIFHFAAFIDDEKEVSDALNGEWLTYGQIRALSEDKMLSSVMTAEIHRIYTVAMAWKTYDRNGRRLYDIKHYRPTFRLRDLKNWDVDFNDTNWLIVSSVNQDRPFFNLRRFYKRIIKGEGR